jgi:hypothetical protein
MTHFFGVRGRFSVLLLATLGMAGMSYQPRAIAQDNPIVAELSGIWTIHSDMDEQVFPSFIVATASLKLDQDDRPENVLGDVAGQFGASIIPPKDNMPVTVEVRCDALMEPSTFKGTLAEAGTEYIVTPKLNWKFDKLVGVRQRIPANIVIKVKLGDQEPTEKTLTVAVRSVNDCPWFVPATDAEGDTDTDMSFMFAAYVNEDHPAVDDILREALDTKIVDAFIGYQAGNVELVNSQVFAIWNTLQKRGIRYSSITTTAGKNEKIYTQHVRFIDESINSQQANCADGAVLFASVLRKIGLKVKLVSVPGHMYVSYSTEAEGENWIGLETTMLGVNNPEEQTKLIELSIDDEWKKEASFKTFENAVAAGTDDLTKNAEKFSDPNATDFQLIDIEGAREIGIIPLSNLR